MPYTWHKTLFKNCVVMADNTSTALLLHLKLFVTHSSPVNSAATSTQCMRSVCVRAWVRERLNTRTPDWPLVSAVPITLALISTWLSHSTGTSAGTASLPTNMATLTATPSSCYNPFSKFISRLWANISHCIRGDVQCTELFGLRCKVKDEGFMCSVRPCLCCSSSGRAPVAQVRVCAKGPRDGKTLLRGPLWTSALTCHISWPILVKFGVGGIRASPPSKCELCASRSNECRTLLNV